MLISQVKSNRIRVLINITDDDDRYLIISNMLTYCIAGPSLREARNIIVPFSNVTV